MSLFDQGWGKDLSKGFEGLNHAPIDNTMRFGDNHGEAVVKTAAIAALLYGLGAGGGYGSDTGGEGLFGSTSSGGAAQTALGQFNPGSLLNGLGGSNDSTTRRKGILGGMPVQTAPALFSNNDNGLIDPTIAKLFSLQGRY